MENILYAIKHVEFLVIEAFVLAAVVAVVVGGVYEIVQMKVQESRRRDKIAQKPMTQEPIAHLPARS